MAEKLLGNQIWQTGNSECEEFSNGDKIDLSRNKSEWRKHISERTPSFMKLVLNGKEEFFYNHFAINDIRGIGQGGFHVPTLSEHDILVETIGGWDSKNRAAKLHDILELSGSFNGNLDSNGEHIGMGLYGAWWISLVNCGFKMPPNQSLYFAVNSNLSFEESHWRKQAFSDMGYQIRLQKNI
jgi:hypothetical protein